MVVSVTHEMFVFFCSVLCGAVLFFVYDLFRLIRQIADPGRMIVHLHDLLFWIMALTVTFFTVLYINNGSVRLYELLGIALGAFLYGFMLSELILKLLRQILAIFSKFFKLFLKILLTPLLFMYNIVYRGIFYMLLPLRRLARRFYRCLRENLRRAFRYVAKNRGNIHESAE